MPMLLRALLDENLIDGNCITVTGKTLGENIEEVTWNPDQKVIHSVKKPLTENGGVVGLWGSMAPEGAMLKIAGLANLTFRGPARVFDGEEACFEAVSNEAFEAGEVLVNVIYQGAVMTGSVAVAFKRVDLPAIQEWVATFVKRENHTGFISFDFFVDEAGKAWAIECNPRVTSGVHFIETEDLAPAILEPGVKPIRLKQTTLMQQFYPTLTEVQAAMFKGPQFWERLKVLRTAQDVTWDARDPMPFITMPIT
eukprot:gene57450-78705_t